MKDRKYKSRFSPECPPPFLAILMYSVFKLMSMFVSGLRAVSVVDISERQKTLSETIVKHLCDIYSNLYGYNYDRVQYYFKCLKRACVTIP